MKCTHLFCFVFFIALTSCNSSSSSNPLPEASSITYSGENNMPWNGPWTEAEIHPESYKGKGECSIVGDKIYYKKIDLSFSGIDYCVNDGQNPEAPDDEFCPYIEFYEIDFSEENPTLKPMEMGGCA